MRGYKPEDFVIFAFGGAGPTHAAGFKEDVRKAVVFPSAPVFCALGSSIMDIVHMYEVSRRMIFMQAITEQLVIDQAAFNETVDKLVATAKQDLLAEGFMSGSATFSLELDMLYGGQVNVKRMASPMLFIRSEADAKAVYHDSSARSFGAEIRTGALVERIMTVDGRVRGVSLAGGEELSAPIVVAATHPQITFLRQLEASELPDAFVQDMRSWKSRSGTVKINLALDRAPVFTAKPDQADLTGGFELAHSIDYLEKAFEEARAGTAATAPFSDGCLPTFADPSLAPEGVHIVSLFTQWCPAGWADEPDDAALDAYADRVIAGYDELAPGFTDSILHRQVLGPHEMQEEWGLVGGNIFHGELSAEQLFHMRPAPGYADYRTPIAGLYQCSSATHAGGGVTGIPAYNCVREIVRDRKRAKRKVQITR